MRWLKLMIILLAIAEAGWMAFDGTRALIVGDYVTPKTGPYAGQLGSWAKLVSTVGIEPRSTVMKSIFAVYGVAWLIVIGCFAFDVKRAGWVMFIAAAGALWYLPVGTLCSALQIVLLVICSTRSR
jgi:hypothetical protein